MSAAFYDLLKYAKTGIAAPDMTAYDKMRAVAMAGGKVKTLTGVPPLSFKSNGKPLISWYMLGNGEQSGTPSPDAPIMPTFCGERTANIYNTQETVWIENTLDDDGNPTGSTTSHYTGNFTAVKPNTLYRISKIAGSTTSGHRIYYYDSDKNWIGRSVALAYNDYSFTTVSGCKYIQIQIGSTIVNTDNWMISEGMSSVSFEPYGYKLPITNAGQTVPIYLGQVQTTRRVRKLVLDGMENWTLQSVNAYGIANFQISISDRLQGLPPPMLSSHFVRQATTIADTQTMGFFPQPGGKLLYLRCDSSIGTNLPDFQAWLAHQKTNGTPVSFWYILETPETAIVNEPLAKIGTYADELHSTDAGVSIPTTKGANTLTVDTDLKPSSMTITYCG